MSLPLEQEQKFLLQQSCPRNKSSQNMSRFLFPLASRLSPKSHVSRLLTPFNYLFNYVLIRKAFQDQPLKIAPSAIWHSLSGIALLTIRYTVDFTFLCCLPSAPLKCQLQVIRVFVLFSAVSLHLRVVPTQHQTVLSKYLLNEPMSGGGEWWARRCLSDAKEGSKYSPGRGWEGDFSLHIVWYLLSFGSCENSSYLKQLKCKRKTRPVSSFHQMGPIMPASPSPRYCIGVSHPGGLSTMSHVPLV